MVWRNENWSSFPFILQKDCHCNSYWRQSHLRNEPTHPQNSNLTPFHLPFIDEIQFSICYSCRPVQKLHSLLNQTRKILFTQANPFQLLSVSQKNKSVKKKYNLHWFNFLLLCYRLIYIILHSTMIQITSNLAKWSKKRKKKEKKPKYKENYWHNLLRTKDNSRRKAIRPFHGYCKAYKTEHLLHFSQIYAKSFSCAQMSLVHFQSYQPFHKNLVQRIVMFWSDRSK